VDDQKPLNEEEARARVRQFINELKIMVDLSNDYISRVDAKIEAIEHLLWLWKNRPEYPERRIDEKKAAEGWDERQWINRNNDK